MDWNIVKEIFMIIISAVIGAFVTYITEFLKLKKQQRAFIIGDNIQNRTVQRVGRNSYSFCVEIRC